MFCGVLWKDLEEIKNKSISASVKRYSRFLRKEMEELSKNIDLRYLLGILNSKYAGELLTNIRGGYMNIYPEHLRNLPIPLVERNLQQPIIDLVEQILSAKKKNSEADTSVLEQEIDALVWGLYGVVD
jgi:adenine-specific DNA-methyltransferase